MQRSKKSFKPCANRVQLHFLPENRSRSQHRPVLRLRLASLYSQLRALSMHGVLAHKAWQTALLQAQMCTSAQLPVSSTAHPSTGQSVHNPNFASCASNSRAFDVAMEQNRSSNVFIALALNEQKIYQTFRLGAYGWTWD